MLKGILDGLINGSKEGLIPKDTIEFLGDISGDFGFPPQNFLFNFELCRLEFTHNVSLK